MKPKKSLSAAYEKSQIRKGFDLIMGCDEVGRGCLAGPVVAAAVVFDPTACMLKLTPEFHEIKDSKLLSARKRERLDTIIKNSCVVYAVGVVSPNIIDKINIHHATLLAMRKAVEKNVKHVSCENKKIFLYVDGKFSVPKISLEQEAVVDGDAKVLSVAAASIIAKVYRDSLMAKMDSQYPNYGFSRHKGYGTPEHQTALRTHGLTKIHRLTFCKKITRPLS